MSYVAFQYAEALFSLALERNEIDNVLVDFKSFLDAQDDEIAKFLNHPKVKKQSKKDVMANGINSTLFKHFVYVLIDNSRMDYLSDCYNEFIKINNNQNKVMNAIVYSNHKLPIIDLNKLKNNLGMKHNRKVNIENVVDESIIGGLRIEYEGNVMDETINNYLETLKHNLTK